MKFKLDVSDVTVVDRPSYLARSMIINPTGKRVQSTSYQQRKGDMTYRLVDPQTKKEIDDGRVIAAKERPLCIEICQRHVSDGFQTFWKVPMCSVKQMFQEAKIRGQQRRQGK